MPHYGLAGAFVGKRFVEGQGWDVNSIIHRPDDSTAELTVGVIRRTTASQGAGLPRVAISEDLARQSVVVALVEPVLGPNDDMWAIVAEAADEEAWRRLEITVDGKVACGHERAYESMWVAYYLTPTLIVFVLAPVSMRPDPVELQELGPGEAPMHRDWPE